MNTTSVRIDSELSKKIRKESAKSGQTMRFGIESAIRQRLSPQYNILDNSNAFHDFLKNKGIGFKPNGHFTLVETNNPLEVGTEWGIYKALNDPAYKK